MEYTVENLKSDIIRKIRCDESSNFLGAINEAARKMLTRIDPSETKRTAYIETAVFFRESRYMCPPDLKSKKVYDIRKQDTRGYWQDFGQLSNRQFDKYYSTNTSLRANEVIDNYNNLWHIERAFRISKTDLKIRPIYHRLRNRIEGHICISFSASAIYKELERALKTEKSYLSVKRAADLTHNMYQLNVRLPQSKHQESFLFRMSREQSDLYQIILKYY